MSSQQVATWLVWLAVVAGRVAASEATSCAQFTVVVDSTDPLGLRLSNAFEIVGFVRDEQMRSRTVEASGLAQVGDRLVAVNGIVLQEASSFASALRVLEQATLPKNLLFEAHDGRCVESQDEATAQDVAKHDYVLLSDGDQDKEEQFFAVASSDGVPPSCPFREVAIANPPHACDMLDSNVTGKYVLVPLMLGCPAHQKAVMAQEAGARAVIFVQDPGQNPQQVRIPPDLPQAIQLPLVMVSAESGVRLMDRLQSSRAIATPLVRFVFSEVCTAEHYAIHPEDDTMQNSIINRIDSVAAGYLLATFANSGIDEARPLAFEFLKPIDVHLDRTQRNPAAFLPLGKQPLRFAVDLNPCVNQQPSSLVAWQRQARDTFVIAPLRASECSIEQQLAFFADNQVQGVIFADPAFHRLASQPDIRSLAERTSIPFVLVSMTALTWMTDYLDTSMSSSNAFVEFTSENALSHHWDDLAALSDVSNWPSTARGRERLYHRIARDHHAVSDLQSRAYLLQHERHDMLEECFERAQQFFDE